MARVRKIDQFGTVCDDLPFNCIIFKKSAKCIMSIPCSTYVTKRNMATLQIVCKSQFLPGRIRAHACDSDWTYVSCGDDTIQCLLRGKTLVHSLGGEDAGDQINCLLKCGQSFLLAGCQSGQLKLWHTESRTLLSSVQLGFPIKNLIHPAAYVDKVIIIMTDRSCDLAMLWDLKRSRCISRILFEDMSILSVAQSPAVDIFAIGTSDGKVSIVNIKEQSQLFSINTAAITEGEKLIGVSALAFHNGHSLLLTGLQNGLIHVCNFGEIASYEH